jgi:hypothetical protein
VGLRAWRAPRLLSCCVPSAFPPWVHGFACVRVVSQPLPLGVLHKHSWGSAELAAIVGDIGPAQVWGLWCWGQQSFAGAGVNVIVRGWGPKYVGAQVCHASLRK